MVVGYPRLLPTRGTCAAAPFATGDYPFARRVGILLNRSLRLAAAAHHATYVGTYGVSRGHDVCAGARAGSTVRRTPPRRRRSTPSRRASGGWPGTSSGC